MLAQLRDSEGHDDRVAWAPEVKRNTTLDPDPVLCSDDWPERLAFARFRERSLCLLLWVVVS